MADQSFSFAIEKWRVKTPNQSGKWGFPGWHLSTIIETPGTDMTWIFYANYQKTVRAQQ